MRAERARASASRGVAALGSHPWEARSGPSSPGFQSGAGGTRAGVWRQKIPAGLPGLKADFLINCSKNKLLIR